MSDSEVQTLGEAPAPLIRGGEGPVPAVETAPEVPLDPVEVAAAAARDALEVETSEIAPDATDVHELKRKARLQRLNHPVYAMALLHEKVDALTAKVDQLLAKKK